MRPTSLLVTSSVRPVLVLLLAGVLTLPGLAFGAGLVAVEPAAPGPAVHAIVHYASFEDVPADARFSQAGFEPTYRFAAIPAVLVWGPEAWLARFESDGGFAGIEHDRPLQYFMDTATFATKAADVWGDAWWPDEAKVQREPVSPIVVDGVPVDGRGVVVGVVDSGVDATHPDLWYAPAHDPSMPWEPKVLACVMLPTLTPDLSVPDCDPASGHGTHVAGIVAGNGWAVRNGLTTRSADKPYVGAAPGAKLAVASVGAGISVPFASMGLDWMYRRADAMGIRIVTNSWGDAPGCDPSVGSASILGITDRLVNEKGVVVLFAAGNYGVAGATWTSSYSRNPTPGVISVANYADLNLGTRDGDVSGDSSDGCVGGASGDMLASWPDLSAPGTAIASTAAKTGVLPAPTWNPGLYGSASGTSMATPHVAGIVALMLQANPDLTPAQVERILVDTAKPYTDAVAARGITGTQMWGDNTAATGFLDKSGCHVTPTDAAKAEAGDESVDARFPGFTTLAQKTDASLFVCRDFKRGAGLVDAYAAVQRALAFRQGGAGSDEPAVRIDSPAEGATVPEGLVDVSGAVSRVGEAPNLAPAATLSAAPTTGPAPLDVAFTLKGTDADGQIASWSFDADSDGAPEASGAGAVPSEPVHHVYGGNGTFVATLSVWDDLGANATATAGISVGGLPRPDGTVDGETYAYNEGGLGASNVVALVTGPAGDPVPKYAAGSTVSIQLRGAASADPQVVIDENTPADLFVFRPDDTVAAGPISMTGRADGGVGGVGSGGYSYDAGKFTIPSDWSGRHYLAPRLLVDGVPRWVRSPSFDGLKPIDVVGAGIATPARAAPATVAGSAEDPEAPDATGDAAAPFVDVEALWIDRETPETFDVVLKLADLSTQPPSVDVGVGRVAVSYTAELCLDNNLNNASADGLFCYRLGAVNGLLGARFSAGVVQRDGTGSCSLADALSKGAFDAAEDAVRWTLRRAALDVTENGANVAACSTAPVQRGGAGVVDGTTLSLLEGSTGVSAGVGVVLTLNGLDATEPSASRPYSFGAGPKPLSVDAGGPYAGDAGAPIAIRAVVAGGEAPVACAWSGAGASFADADACETTVSFATAGSHEIRVDATDAANATSGDVATVQVGAPGAERVDLFVDDEAQPRASAPVTTGPSSPRASWSATLDLSGLSGARVLTARWIDADGLVLATARVNLTVASAGPAAFVAIDEPADDPSGDSPRQGTIAVSGRAGHGNATTASGGGGAETINAAGFPLWSGSRGGFRTTSLSGETLGPCAGCEPTEPFPGVRDPGDLGTSLAWLSGPSSDFQGVDGYWFSIPGHGGSAYVLTDEYDVPHDLRFFADWEDLQDAQLGAHDGPGMPKEGVVPEGANWAFAYMRRPSVSYPETFIGILTLNLTPPTVPPSAPQDFVAVPGSRSVHLTWQAPANDGGALTGYHLYRDGVLVAAPGPGATSHTDEDLAPGVVHAYALRAHNGAGEGAAATLSAAALPEADALAITSPADGATGVSPHAALSGAYVPRAGGGARADGPFANTHYLFLMNLNDGGCAQDLGYGDVLIASKLIAHARERLGVPDANVHYFNEHGGPLCPTNDPAHYDQLPAEFRFPSNPFDGPAQLAPFAERLAKVALKAAESEAAGGPPARVFILHSSHGFYDVGPDHRTASSMALYQETVHDRDFGDALTAALDAAEAATNVSIETAILIDCSFCGGFADSPLWLPGTTTTSVDTANVVGKNRVVEVGCTWITECFGNPAVTYDHMFNECAFTGRADGWGPAVATGVAAHPAPDGSDDLGGDLVVPDARHHPKDGLVTVEEAYWCALDSVKGALGSGGFFPDAIGIQQMFQLVDQMGADLFGGDGFVVWAADSALDVPALDPAQPVRAPDVLLPRTSAQDAQGDSRTPYGDLVAIHATATSTHVVVDLDVKDLSLSAQEAEDVVAYDVFVNGERIEVCHSLGLVSVYSYDQGKEVGTATYDFDRHRVHVKIPHAALANPTLPASVRAQSQLGACSAVMPLVDDRIPDAGTIATSTAEEPTVNPGRDSVRVRLDGPDGATVQGEAVLDAANRSWTFAPASPLANGTWTATAEHFFDDGSGFVKVDGPVNATFSVGAGADATPPSAPADLRVAGVSGASVELAWDAATDDAGVARYRVHRATQPGVPPSDANLVGTTTTLAFTDATVAPNATYHYVVVAEDAAGNRGPASNEVSATTPPLATAQEVVLLYVDDATTPFATLQVDSTATGEAAWSAVLDTTTLGDGFHVLRAVYDDGAGGMATDEATFLVQNGAPSGATASGTLPLRSALPWPR